MPKPEPELSHAATALLIFGAIALGAIAGINVAILITR